MKPASVTTAVTATSRLTTNNMRPPGRAPSCRLALGRWRLGDVLLGVLRPLDDSLVQSTRPACYLFGVGAQVAAKAQSNAQKECLQGIGAISLLSLGGFLVEADCGGTLAVQGKLERYGWSTRGREPRSS